MTTELETLIETAYHGTLDDVAKLSKFVGTTISDPEKLEYGARMLIKANRDRHPRFILIAARLYRQAGNLEKEKLILADLADDGYAPATHLLGAIFYQEGKVDRALELFHEAMELRYKIGASAYYTAKKKQSVWPISAIFGIIAKGYLVSSKLEMERRGVPDHAALWPPSD